MQSIVSTTEALQAVPTVNQQTGEDSYIIRIEMIDGTSQLLHLSMEQAVALGVHNIGIENKDKPPKTTPSTMLNYKIVQPADLNLCNKEEPAIIVSTDTGISRGRPKKRPKESLLKNDVVDIAPTKIVNTSRTRYGRITKPPTHMEKDYEKIVTNVKSSMETTKELDTVQFEPIKTSNSKTEPPPLVALESNPKKRNIPAQYKCPTCKKAYLGRNRMACHLKKYPDHGATSQVMMQDCNTWYFLIETAQKANKGKRGEKFCKEFLNLIRNARIMAKNFLKPAKVEKTEYIVDSFLAEVLNIKEGNYRFNESGICKDVNIFSFLLDDSFLETDNTNTHTSIPPIQEVKNKPVIDLHFDSDITYAMDMNESPKKELFMLDNTSTPLKSTSDNKTIDPQLDMLQMFHDGFNEKLFSENKKSENATQQDQVGKEVDIFRNTIPNILTFGASDEHMSTLLDKEKKTRKSDEFDLNKLHLVEFIPDAPVNSILDTSTGSDDIMNVDQFVNERFKNLTEPDGDMQCFSFNS